LATSIFGGLGAYVMAHLLENKVMAVKILKDALLTALSNE